MTPTQFLRVVLDWVDTRGVYVPINLLYTNDDSWICDVGHGTYADSICAQWWEDTPTQCSTLALGHQQFEPTEQGLTDALIELACRMEAKDEQ